MALVIIVLFNNKIYMYLYIDKPGERLGFFTESDEL